MHFRRCRIRESGTKYFVFRRPYFFCQTKSQSVNSTHELFLAQELRQNIETGSAQLGRESCFVTAVLITRHAHHAFALVCPGQSKRARSSSRLTTILVRNFHGFIVQERRKLRRHWGYGQPSDAIAFHDTSSRFGFEASEDVPVVVLLRQLTVGRSAGFMCILFQDSDRALDVSGPRRTSDTQNTFNRQRYTC